MSKHTPGPWKVSHETDISGIENDPANGCVGAVDVAHVYLRTVPGRTEANARLIAAAPELLEALSAFLRAPSVGSNGPGSSTIVVQDFNLRAARAAIAKATGGAA